MQLVVGNKNYSSWSMRPWVLMRELGMPFEEVCVRFDSFSPNSQFKQTMHQLGSPAGKVPLLIDGAATYNASPLVVHDSLAIVERLFELNPAVWPSEVGTRAKARSACADMHSGFESLRRLCGMNIEADLSEQGATLWREHDGLRSDVARIDALWGELLAHSSGPMLCGQFCAVDAFFAPVVMRINGYALPVSPNARAYADRVTQLASVQAWIQAALAEHDFLDFEEPYRTKA